MNTDHGRLESAPTCTDHPLGNVVLRCRQRPLTEILGELWNMPGWLACWIWQPCFVMLLISVMVAVLPVIALNSGEVPNEMPIYFHIVFGTTYLVILWFGYFKPLEDHLVVREKGLQLAVWLKRLEARFDEIDEVVLGCEWSRWQRLVMRFGATMKAREVRWAEQIASKALTIKLKNGASHVFDSAQTRFNLDDFGQVLERLKQHQPGIRIRSAD